MVKNTAGSIAGYGILLYYSSEGRWIIFRTMSLLKKIFSLFGDPVLALGGFHPVHITPAQIALSLQIINFMVKIDPGNAKFGCKM